MKRPRISKKELCANWIMDMVEKHDGKIDLNEITIAGDEIGFTRGMIYSSRKFLKGIVWGGNGRHTIIYNVDKYLESKLVIYDKKPVYYKKV